MTPEQEQILREVKQLSVENAETLRLIRRSYRIGNVMRVAYWVFLIALSVGALYFLQPFVDTAKDAYGELISF